MYRARTYRNLPHVKFNDLSLRQASYCLEEITNAIHEIVFGDFNKYFSGLAFRQQLGCFTLFPRF